MSTTQPCKAAQGLASKLKNPKTIPFVRPLIFKSLNFAFAFRLSASLRVRFTSMVSHKNRDIWLAIFRALVNFSDIPMSFLAQKKIKAHQKKT